MNPQKETELVPPMNLDPQKEELEIEAVELKIEKHESMSFSDKPHYIFFLFVNPTSGGNRASAFTKLDVERIIFSTFNPKNAEVEVCLYSMTNKTNRDQGLQFLKSEQVRGKHILRVVVGGGDGTVLWVVEEMLKVGIDISKCPIGIIPFGTGNDFSRVLGWGGVAPNVLIGTHLSGLKSLVNKWVEASVEDFDIWDVVIETHEYGGIKKIYNDGKSKFVKKFMSREHEETKEQVNITVLKKKMCNYFSFGIDSRIGYGFDKKRTRSRFKNQLVYMCEGIKKMFLRTPKVNDVLEVIHYDNEYHKNEANNDPGAQQVEQVIGENFSLYPTIKNKNSQNGQSMSTSQHAAPPSENSKTSLIKGNHAVFLCLNIPSYMGGASDPWRTSKGKVGVTDHSKSKFPDFPEQKFGDGKVELIGFMGSLSLAMERFISGQGWRLGQVQGPFCVDFRQSPDPKKPVHTYMQVDGEFYNIVAPKTVRVSLSKELPNGKIKVMVNPDIRKKKP